MQRILFCTDSLVAGGAEQQLIELLQRLDRKRFAPFVVCLYGEASGRSVHHLRTLHTLGVPVVVLDKRGKACLLVALARVVWQVRPDLIQTVNYHSNLLMRLARLFLPYRVRLISGIYIEYTRRQLLYERLSAWVCAALVCNSPVTQSHLRHVLRRPVELISNGIDLERFGSNPNTGLRHSFARDEPFVLLYLGRLNRQKGVSLVVEALGFLLRCGQLPAEAQLWIVGDCDDPEAHRLHTLIEAWGLNGFVRWFPATYEPEAYYHAAEVVVLPSMSEALPNVMLESLAAGRPVVLSQAANKAGIVQHGETGWVTRTGDVEHLAATLAEVLNMPASELMEMRDLCRRRALPFAASRMADAYMALYDQLSSP